MARFVSLFGGSALLAGSLLLGGCMFQHLTPARQLRDRVYQLNDETRWARIDLATDHVTSEYRARFLLAHREWGHDVAIADADPTHIQIDDGGDHARSLVTVTWYDQRTMELSRTVLSQQWRRTDNGYRLEAETIVGGSEELFAPVDERQLEAATSHATTPLANR